VHEREYKRKSCNYTHLWQKFKLFDEFSEVASGDEVHAEVQVVLALEGKFQSRSKRMRRLQGHGVQNVSLSFGLPLI